jgi:hypothetical protein
MFKLVRAHSGRVQIDLELRAGDGAVPPFEFVTTETKPNGRGKSTQATLGKPNEAFVAFAKASARALKRGLVVAHAKPTFETGWLRSMAWCGPGPARATIDPRLGAVAVANPHLKVETGGEPSVVELLSAATAEIVGRVPLPGIASAIAIDPTGRHLACTGNGRLWIYELASRRFATCVIDGAASSPSFDASGARIACMTDRSTVVFDVAEAIDAPRPRPIVEIEGGMRGSAASAARLSPSGEQIAIANDRIALHEVGSGAEVRVLDAVPARAIAFAKRGLWLVAATVGDGDPLRIWDLDEQKAVDLDLAEVAGARAIDVDASGKLLALGSTTHGVRVVDLDAAAIRFESFVHASGIVDVAFGPGSALVSCDQAGFVAVHGVAAALAAGGYRGPHLSI